MNAREIAGPTEVPAANAMPRARRPWAMVRLGMAHPTSNASDAYLTFPAVYAVRQLARRGPAWPEQPWTPSTRRRREPSQGKGGAARSDSRELRGHGHRRMIVCPVAAATGAPVRAPTTVENGEHTKGTYGNLGNIWEVGDKPKRLRKEIATVLYTPLHIGCSRNGKGGDRDMGTETPLTIAINHLVINHITTLIISLIGRVITITGTDPMRRPTARVARARLLCHALVAAKPC